MGIMNPCKPLIALLGVLLFSGHMAAAANKPLKIFILAGQSNMQGHAKVETIAGIAMDPKTKPMSEEKCDSNGEPQVVKDTFINYLAKNRSNQAFRYHGSAKTRGGIGMALADALAA